MRARKEQLTRCSMAHQSYREGKLTWRQRSRIRKKFQVEQLLCERCGRLVRLGSPYYVKYPTNPIDERRRSPGSCHSGRIYHKKCFDEMRI
jgi:hypothetical protein